MSLTETICKKCAVRGETKWHPTSNAVYKRLFNRMVWFRDIDEKESNSIKENLAGQLQLIELFHKLHEDCNLNQETDADSEVESLLCKQEVCIIGAVVETICYVTLKSNKVNLPKRPHFASLLRLIEEEKILLEDEIKLCLKIKELRNRIHLFDQVSTDLETFSRNEFDLANMCLYFLLQRWLDASDNIMQTYFPFIPQASKEKIFSF